MTGSWAGVIFVLALIGTLAAAYRPLGDYMARVFTSHRHLRVEQLVYRATGVNPDADQAWPTYLKSLLAFSAVSVLLLYAILRLQRYLPYSLGFKGMSPALAWNTATSFTTSTNWQNYAGESTLGYTAQMAGLAVQNFASAAVGLAVAIALLRGFARQKTDQLGNFWVDLVRGVFRILLPISFVAAIVLVAGGAIQTFDHARTVTTLAGAHQRLTNGPFASQEAIKELGNNGGGTYNANSAHPFENPTQWSNWLEICLLLLIPACLPRTFGKVVGDTRQGLAIVATMLIIALISVVSITGFEELHHGSVPTAVGASMEGKEVRFGIPDSAAFATATTLTSTGAVNSSMDSFTSLAGGMLMLDMMYGEVAPGGIGAGLYGMLILAIVTVFVAGLMVGRTPEYLGKKIGAREVKFASLYILCTPFFVLVFTGLAMALPGERAAMANQGAHGLSEVLYAFTSQGNNNGSAFAGLASNTTWYNTAGGIVMVGARFIPIILVLGLAGSLARQHHVPVSEGTLPTHGLLFVGMLTGVTIIVVALTYFPALALGPLAEGLH
ncbi:MAG: potassium-transporting ATPase subunit KdpA [Mycobacteriales bacterium]